MSYFSIKEMDYRERPREKLINKGVRFLSNAELLSILIRTGNKNDDAITLSTKILSKSRHGIRGLEELSVEQLCEIEGIGISKATVIKAALEIGNRVSSYRPEKYSIKNPHDLYKYYIQEMRYLKKEVFKVIVLNTKNEIITDEDVFIGTLNQSIVHPREVFVEAIKRNGNSIILMHNHPSGNPSPSDEDIDVTNRMRECGDILGIKVLDHIIIGDGIYYSLEEHEK
ncbi:RadC family protein [Peptostreptococcus faecalis]|uniref:RadC family protein n=1 Tax=Peptostreptococcus faecalis TaxID=2045015 RepID=UPI001FA8DB34|nr:DNA repair protein RadC [Peptostreptococcus faecalis]